MTTAQVDLPLSPRERYTGLLLGSLVADSLTLPAHWSYDQAEIAAMGRVTELQGAPADGYHPQKDRGALTHYGDQAMVLLESLDACGGNFVIEDFAKRWRALWDKSPAYRDINTNETLAHLKEGQGLSRAGSDSPQLGGAVRLASLLLALRTDEQPLIIAAARAQTVLTHRDPAVVDAAEFIAHTVFLLMRGVTIASALPMAASLPYKALKAEAYLREAQDMHDVPLLEAIEEIGQACPIDQALPSIFAILLRHGDDFETALIENVMAGGDSAGRGMMLGLLLGAAHGRRAIPERWTDPLQARPKAETYLKTVGL